MGPLQQCKMVLLVQDEAAFDAKLSEAGDKLVVVDFYATWCGPCKRIAPELEAFDKELDGSVVFLKVDVDQCEEVALKYKISCMPTFIFFKNGEKVDEISGADMSKIKSKVGKHK